MQGPPPTSPAYNMAPPIKKQRGTEGGPPIGDGPPTGGPPTNGPPPMGGGPPMTRGPPPGNGPPVGDASAQRRAQLQNLRAGYANRPNFGPPPSRGTIPQIGFNPGAARQQTNGTTTNKPATTTNGTTGPVPVPNRAPNLARDSDIFPSAPKAETPAVARRLDVAFQEPTPAAATKAPPVVPTTPAAPKVSFAPTPKVMPPSSPDGATGVSVASTPEPITSPPPTNMMAAQTPAAATMNNAGHTPFPSQNNESKNVGHTPHPGKVVMSPETPSADTSPPKNVHFASTAAAGRTPHPKANQEEPSTTNRRQKFAQMRDVADTPPPKSQPVVSFADSVAKSETTTTTTTTTTRNNNSTTATSSTMVHEESVELRMQRQLTEETKKNEQLLRQVADLEERLANQATKSAAKVSFMPSPAKSTSMMDRLTPTRRRASTPFPKRSQEESDEIDLQFLEEATEDVPYKFEAGTEDDGDEDVQAVFVIRRPYGYGDMDHELWFAAGEKNAKLYHRDATVENVDSIEVAVQIGVDESVLLLYNEADVRHQNAVEGTWKSYGNVYERGDPLGMVAYIDVDANEKEYSLDKLVEQAIDVRKHYCASLRNMAIGLQRRAQEGGSGMTPRGGVMSPMADPGEPASPKVDACVGTEEEMNPPAEVAQARGPPPGQEGGPPALQSPPSLPPPQAVHHEPSTDIFSVFIGLISAIIFSIIKIPYDAFRTLVVWGLTAVLGLLVYLWLLDNMGWTGVAPPLYYYHNPPGIM